VHTGQARGISPKYAGIIDCGLQIYKAHGVTGLFRGTLATTLREVPSVGLYFSAYRHCKEMLTPSGQEPSTPVTIFAGGVAGSVSWASVYPFDVIKSNMQISKPGERAKGLLETATDLYRRHGLSAFGKGLGPTILRAFPVNGATFLCYEYLKKTISPHYIVNERDVIYY
jgi:Mitochondrial carrier protein